MPDEKALQKKRGSKQAHDLEHLRRDEKAVAAATKIEAVQRGKMARRHVADEKAKKAFQEAGGDETIFQLEKQKSMLEELATKLESCVDALGLEANVQPTNDQLATCAGEAQAVFEEVGVVWPMDEHHNVEMWLFAS